MKLTKNLGGMGDSTLTNLLNVASGQAPLQTSNAVSIDTGTQQFLILLLVGAAAAFMLLRTK